MQIAHAACNFVSSGTIDTALLGENYYSQLFSVLQKIQAENLSELPTQSCLWDFLFAMKSHN